MVALALALALLAGCTSGLFKAKDRGDEHRYEPIEDGRPNKDQHPEVRLTPVWGGTGPVGIFW